MEDIKILIEKAKIYGLAKFIRYAIHELYLTIWRRWVRKSYSQCWEDLVIDHLLGKKRGFYVDVGANDPVRFSNTNRFYQKGWCGINIEPDPDRFARLKKERRRDKNLNIGISSVNTKLHFFQFFPDTLSTFSAPEAKRYQKLGFKLVEKKMIDVRRLADVLKIYCKDTPIDFMSVDTEGHDLVVLGSNDWRRFRPRVICVEGSDENLLGDASKSDQKVKIIRYLSSKGYRKHLDNGLNMVFIDGGYKA